MAYVKEIRTKINSIKKMQKMTSAMEMVAASKMRKTQDRMYLSRPYADKIYDMIGHVARGHLEYHHPFLQQREVKRVGYIIVSTDRGLCGGLNNNLFRAVISEIKQWDERDIGVELCTIGVKAEHFFQRIGGNIVASADHLGDAPEVAKLVGIVKVMLDKFSAGELDKLYIAHNRFVSTMSQKPVIKQLLPLPPATEKKLEYHWDYIYEPEAKQLLDLLLTRYIESQVYQAVVENIACEQAAKMIAMRNASDNAGELIDDLQLAYNKARQATITKELAEIVSGAAAV